MKHEIWVFAVKAFVVVALIILAFVLLDWWDVIDLNRHYFSGVGLR